MGGAQVKRKVCVCTCVCVCVSVHQCVQSVTHQSVTVCACAGVHTCIGACLCVCVCVGGCLGGGWGGGGGGGTDRIVWRGDLALLTLMHTESLLHSLLCAQKTNKIYSAVRPHCKGRKNKGLL